MPLNASIRSKNSVHSSHYSHELNGAQNASFDEEEEGPRKVYSERWLMLAMFCCCTGVNAAGWISFSPLFSLLEDE
jgi:hypothetical protein